MGTVDRTRMYAHIYFDLKNDQLGLVVYSIAKIPNFSGKLSPELKSEFGHTNAYDVFTHTLKDHISPDEIQSGKAFSYTGVQDKVEKLDAFSKLFNPNAKMTIDLDSKEFWEEFLEAAYPSSVVQQFRALSTEEKSKILNQLREDFFKSKLNKAETAEQIQQALIDIYNDISRTLYRKTGGKEYAGTTTYKFPSPPTFLMSKEIDMVYYPGYRGAQYMTKTPDSLKMVHPLTAPDEEKWHSTLIEDTKLYTNQISLKGNFDIVELDNIAESLALLFYDRIKNFGNKNLTFLNFQSAANPVKEAAKQRLQKLKALKKAFQRFAGVEGDLVGVWVDLSNGQIFDSKSELLASKSEKQERLLAAKRTIDKPNKEGSK